MLKRIIVLAVAVFMAGCGSDNKSGSEMPKTAEEAKAIYMSSPHLLSQPSTVTINPENQITIEGERAIVSYKGKEIYNQVNGWGTYFFNCFTSTGEYLLLIWEYPVGHPTGFSKIFINGEPINAPTQYPIRDIREYKDGWLIFISQPMDQSKLLMSWAMYNYLTKEFMELGITEQTNL